ncbi:MAG TPA: cation:proton antiporter [Chthoniobacteraceae bacterium]|nr:cation:proton antiporter [Chthoniobacteraceae bacterium]
MIVAAAVSLIFRQLKQPVVLGYILAGVIIGPHTPPFPLIVDEEAIRTLSELGVVFLMFALGLEFSLRKLRDVGATALIAATLEILLMVWAGYELGRLFGWSQMDSIFLGAILSISSTTIIIKALEELGKTKEKFAQIVFGILIVEDILAIVMIALLSGFAATGSFAPAEVGGTIAKLSAFLGVLLVAGLITVPRLIDYVARFKSNEMLLITVVGLCFGVSLLTVKLGYSVALGAFLIGAIVAEARQIAKIEALMHPVRDLFSAVFFVAIGLLIDPSLLAKYFGQILIITAVVIIGKVFACSIGPFLAGHDQRSSLRVGMGLAQIGEFSFIIAALGLSLKVTSDFVYPIAVAVSVLTTLTTPYLIRWSDPLVSWFDRVAPAPLVGVLDAYTDWVGRLQVNRDDSLAGPMLRTWGWQIALNLLLVSAIFISAVALRGRALAWWPDVPGGLNGLKAMLWLGAMVLSLPLIIASFRKLQATGMLISEISVTREAAGDRTAALRGVVSGTIVAAGCGGLILFVLLLSSAILPSRNALIVAGLVVIVAAIILWRWFIRLYSRGQIALRETFAQEPEPRVDEPAILPAFLHEASLQLIPIHDKAEAAGKVIGDLRLRTRTGASIVGIERASQNIINPGPDEEIVAGDRVLLLGTKEQLEAAEELLAVRI